ncbi:uncharacterized protein LOC115274449 [Suricata suricatta]|uniref:uncharacterized protein LOC115274449 n=1 Tax=Suricata suricatta TaxID=37032 RepID=UPI0011553BEF|nr:uncharacterized protein LOC115274449 [Suricata suricatta]
MKTQVTPTVTDRQYRRETQLGVAKSQFQGKQIISMSSRHRQDKNVTTVNEKRAAWLCGQPGVGRQAPGAPLATRWSSYDLEVRSLNQSVGKTVLLLETSWGESASLSFAASTSHLHSLAHGLFLHLQSTSLHPLLRLSHVLLLPLTFSSPSYDKPGDHSFLHEKHSVMMENGTPLKQDTGEYPKHKHTHTHTHTHTRLKHPPSAAGHQSCWEPHHPPRAPQLPISFQRSPFPPLNSSQAEALLEDARTFSRANMLWN